MSYHAEIFPGEFWESEDGKNWHRVSKAPERVPQKPQNKKSNKDKPSELGPIRERDIVRFEMALEEMYPSVGIEE